MDNRTLAEMIVDQVLDELQRRAGFDGWWDGIDLDTKADIRSVLASKVELING